MNEYVRLMLRWCNLGGLITAKVFLFFTTVMFVLATLFYFTVVGLNSAFTSWADYAAIIQASTLADGLLISGIAWCLHVVAKLLSQRLSARYFAC